MVQSHSAVVWMGLEWSFHFFFFNSSFLHHFVETYGHRLAPVLTQSVSGLQQRFRTWLGLIQFFTQKQHQVVLKTFTVCTTSFLMQPQMTNVSNLVQNSFQALLRPKNFVRTSPQLLIMSQNLVRTIPCVLIWSGGPAFYKRQKVGLICKAQYIKS